ncbi:MAG TPA: hypothetical protein VES95_01970 [Dermatophilaceae bacterium]|nr:hypothetical protein [Dermatophilaceae bacterium]
MAGGWLAYLGVLQWSVVRFRVPIVLTLTAVALGLAAWLVLRREVRLPVWWGVLVPVASVVLLWTVPLFSYLRGGWLTAALAVVTVVGVLGALLLARGTPGAADLAHLVAVAGHAVLAAVVILGDRAPRIDVWVILQQASDGLARGENMYSATWTGSPGVQDAFPYLPWTAVLLAPGRWLFGDVRWSLAAWTVVLLLGLRALAVPPRPDGAAGAAGPARGPSAGRGPWAWPAAVAAVALVVAPGGITQVDQAWTEPLLAAGLVWWAVLVRRGQAWWAVVPLALACASKQHLVLLLPVLAAWPAFGVKRTAAAAGLAGALCLPWFLASPADFLHDTVTLLVGFHPIRFANTWHLYLLNEHGVEPPFWLTGLLVVGTVAAAALTVARRRPDLPELLRWLALVLLAANLVNKQAFYNQFWLSAALVAASLALAPPPLTEPRPAPRDVAATRG